MNAPTAKKFDWVSLYAVKGRWRLTTCKIGGRRITRRLGKQQAVAERYAAKVSDWLEQHRSGLLSTDRLLTLLGESLPVDGLLSLYEKSLKASGCEEDYINTVVPRIRILMEVGEITRASHITVAAVNRALGELHEKGRNKKRLSDQTIRHYGTAIKQFVKFLMRPPHKVFEVDPLIGIDRRAIETINRVRRAPSREELSLLLGAVRIQKLGVFNMPGRDRCMLYAFALATGLRAKELRSVLVNYVDLEKGTIEVPGIQTKNGEPAYQPLPAWLIIEARDWMKDREPQERLWPTLPKRLAMGLRADQLAARKQWIESAPDQAERERREKCDLLRYKTAKGYFDFHAMRHAYVTRIVEGGATVKEAQSLARHSDPKLTIGLYSHAEAESLRVQVDSSIPSPL